MPECDLSLTEAITEEASAAHLRISDSLAILDVQWLPGYQAAYNCRYGGESYLVSAGGDEWAIVRVVKRFGGLIRIGLIPGGIVLPNASTDIKQVEERAIALADVIKSHLSAVPVFRFPAAQVMDRPWMEPMLLRNGFVQGRRLPRWTSILDLAPSCVELRAGLHQKWRNQLSKSETTDLEILVSNEPGDAQRLHCLLMQMYERKGFGMKLDTVFFAELRDSWSRGNLEVLLAMAPGVAEPVAGVLVGRHGGVGTYLVGASTSIGYEMNAPTRLQWEAICRLKSQGLIRYDIGGIDWRGNASVYQFKKRIGGVPVCDSRWLLDARHSRSARLIGCAF